MKFSSNFAVVMKTSSLQLPPLAGTLSIKSVLQTAPKHVIFILKINKFLGSGHSPLPRPVPQREGDTPSRQREGDTPSRTHYPQRLRRLDLRAFGTHSRTPLPPLGSLATGLSVATVPRQTLLRYVCLQQTFHHLIAQGLVLVEFVLKFWRKNSSGF